MEVSNQNYMDEAVFKEVRKKGLLAFGVYGGVLLSIFSITIDLLFFDDIGFQKHIFIYLIILALIAIFLFQCFYIFKTIQKLTNSKIYNDFIACFICLIAILLLYIITKFENSYWIVYGSIGLGLLLFVCYKIISIHLKLKELSDENLFFIYGYLLCFICTMSLISCLFFDLPIKFHKFIYLIVDIVYIIATIIIFLAWYRVKYFKVLPKLAD